MEVDTPNIYIALILQNCWFYSIYQSVDIGGEEPYSFPSFRWKKVVLYIQSVVLIVVISCCERE